MKFDLASPSVLLAVGNAPSADTPEIGRAITAAHRVMRFNNFPAGKHIPARCDIWATSLNIQIIPPTPMPPEVWWVGHPRPLRLASFDPKHITRRVSSTDRAALGELCSPFHCSTGLLGVWMALEWGYRVVLAGFEHFAGRLHYWAPRNDIERGLEAQTGQWHSATVERAAFSTFVAAGAVEYFRT